MDPHAGFILAAYAAGALVMLALAAAVLRDHRAQAARLAELERRAPRRRGGA